MFVARTLPAFGGPYVAVICAALLERADSIGTSLTYASTNMHVVACMAQEYAFRERELRSGKQPLHKFSPLAKWSLSLSFDVCFHLVARLLALFHVPPSIRANSSQAIYGSVGCWSRTSLPICGSRRRQARRTPDSVESVRPSDQQRPKGEAPDSRGSRMVDVDSR